MLSYSFGQLQDYRIFVFDYNGKQENFNANLLDANPNVEQVSTIDFSLMDLIRNNGRLRFPIMHPSTYLTVCGAVMSGVRDQFITAFSASKLVNKEGFFATSDPFLRMLM